MTTTTPHETAAVSSARPLPPPRGRRRVFLRDLGIVLVLNTVVAVTLWLIVVAMTPESSSQQQLEALGSHLVFSQCIGLCIFGLIEWPRLTSWWERPPRWLALGGVTLVAIPVGHTMGRLLAGALLGVSSGLAHPLEPAMALVAFTTIVASLVAVHLITQRDHIESERLRAENADVRAASARLQLLQQQIEPHMLFNTLANAHALIDTEPARAQAMLEALSELLHASMQTGEQPLVTLQQEFNLLEQYLNLMAIRMGPRLRHTLHLPAELQGCRLPPLTLQPLVENAVRHGLDARPEGGSIHVSARRDGAQVLIEVVDDGQGLSVDDPFAAGRIGLANLRQRLAYAFGDEAGLTLADHAPHGVRATVRIPQASPA
ncbi:sensor histidine kinase [Piscinibacter gummiphilus]|uniref:Histidine kinase n=1 Tax=Piscinibacter gummiphilus TaxID=946333 RepID=A0ABZ0CTH0_9BURK|nr:histidine kinase [Piscinibacter gummiphilus]WOB07821.1 histidine kinase [Piscinibacter gummiphilus]